MQENIVNESNINKVSLIICWIMGIVGSAIAYTMNNQISDALISFALVAAFFSVTTVIYFIKSDNPIIKYLLNLDIYIIMFILMYIQNGAKDNAFALFSPVICTVLFFDMSLTLFSLISGNVLTIGLYILYGPIFFPYFTPSEIITLCICMITNGLIVLAHIHWVKKLVNKLKTGENESNILNTKMENILKNVAETSEILDKSVIKLDQDAEISRDGINQIVGSIQQAGQTLEIQSNSTNEIVNSLSKIKDIINTVTDGSGEMSASSNIAFDAADSGKNSIEDLVKQIQVIKETSKNSLETILDLNSQSREINEIVSLINDVAGQINLLSLNASIEAARAGEHGRGFAVVANEIKNLATQTSNSVKEISIILDHITKKISNVTSQINSGNEAVEKGIYITDESEKHFKNISGKVTDIRDIASIVQKKLNNLLSEFTVIFEKVEDIGILSQHSASTMEEITQNTVSQNNRILDLKELIQELVDLSKQLKNLIN